MADLKTGRTGGLTVNWTDEWSNPNATSTRRLPEMPTRIATTNTLSIRSRKPQDTTWSEIVYVIANPESFVESVSPQYSRRPVLGLSHDVVQYVRTDSREISMELWCSYHVVMRNIPSLTNDQALHRLIKHRNFFESLTVPSGPRQAPPLAHVNWPEANLYFQGVVTGMNIEYTQFAHSGAPMEFFIDVSFLESSRGLMTHDRVKQTGWGGRIGHYDWMDLE